MTDSQRIGARIRARREELGMTQTDLGDALGLHKSTINRYETGEIVRIKLPLLQEIARKLDVSPEWLALKTDDQGKYFANAEQSSGAYGFPHPKITDNVVTFPVLGEVAAGYEHIAVEDWSGDTVEVPTQYLHGRPMSDFIVLTVHGDSMYPAFMAGDKVLVLLTPELEYSGQVGLVRYDGEMATLKRIEYPETREWLRLVPINPSYSPRTISDEALADCSIIGIPRLIIRTVQ